MLYWFLEAIKKYAVFTGRACRKEYWYFILGHFLLAILATALDSALGTVYTLAPGIPVYHGVGWIRVTLQLFLLVPSMSVLCRRLHDVGKSGYWVLGLILGACLLTMIMFIGTTITIGLMAAGFTQISIIGRVYLTGLGILSLGLLVYNIILLVWTIMPGQKGQNKYGPDPLEPEQAYGERYDNRM